MDDKQNNNFIFTDTYITKQILWDGYNGYVQHYNNYLMYEGLGRPDHVITIAGLKKYANDFWEEIYYFLEKFEKELGKEEIEKAKEIFNKEEIEKEDYIFLRRFFNKFMSKTGIKDVSKEKNDPNTSVEDGLY